MNPLNLKSVTRYLLSALLCAAVAPLWAQTPPAPQTAQTTAPPSVQTAATTAPVAPPSVAATPALPNSQDYRLGAGDAIGVQVYQSPDLSIDARVSESGVISYPLVGSVQLGGLTIAEAEKKIADALRSGGFVKVPQVNIVLRQVRGNQVAVLGQVSRPGRFPLETFNTRVSDMLAAAGGTTPTGDDVLIVTGQRDGKPFRKVIDIPALFLNEKSDEDIVLAGGDTLYVNKAPMFYIYGEAQRPGPYRIERGMTVMQALAQGGGPTVRGSQNRLKLHRRDASGKVVETTPNLNDLVRPEDVIYVRESLF
ncbi:polysaccharide export protein EpsE [Polaromonas sp. JS666]|uniref:polysaccharide export protein EpsE n=1 Tax=Polaromonas sp. (strain JS666 / ATCC BAA-500) TaxID=296591 RepID=UPI00088A241C|nr:polysaccharide export protein EpsE [Polaromonas sp. JS666]SDM80817.1 polysaccharide export outer membrane protein [Polaromonas sp. JS666]